VTTEGKIQGVLSLNFLRKGDIFKIVKTCILSSAQVDSICLFRDATSRTS